MRAWSESDGKARGVHSQHQCWESQHQGQSSQHHRNVQMGTLPASRSQHQCWEIGADAGSQMGTAGSQHSDGSQHWCWEPTGNRLGVKILVVPITGAGNQPDDGTSGSPQARTFVMF